MPSVFENMQFATAVYEASKTNKIGIPAGWTLADWVPDEFSGFSAGYFINANNEIVISYTGTNSAIADPLNWTAGLGLPVPQIFAALQYYFRVSEANPTATVSRF